MNPTPPPTPDGLPLLPKDPSLSGRRILVTGAGGSIGSALVRRLAGLGCEHLALLDLAESALWNLHQELREQESRHALFVADVADEGSIREILRQTRPDTVFHAAALKQVPLLETQLVAAARANILGTAHVLTQGEALGVRNIVFLSTDKAVQPISVMGATKRIAELLVGAPRNLRAVSLRLGNVRGTQGSVIPRFDTLIRDRKPLTITDPEARRFFLTMDEATGLLLRALAIGRGGDILVPTLAPAVRMLDLAQERIRAAGLKPGTDVRMQVVGLRPGERKFEALLGPDEVPREVVDGIQLLSSPRATLSPRYMVQTLEMAIAHRDASAVLRFLRQALPSYRPSELARRASGTPSASADVSPAP